MNSIQDVLAKFDSIEVCKKIIIQDIQIPTFSHYETKIYTVESDVNQEQISNEEIKMENGIVDIDTFLHNFDLTIDLEKYFQEHKSFSSSDIALIQLSELISTGISKIYNNYSILLNLQAFPLKIKYDVFINEQDENSNVNYQIKILRRETDLLSNNDIDSLLKKETEIIQLCPESAVRDLHKLIQRLQLVKINNKQTEFISNYLEIYSSSRGSFLLQSIDSTFSLEAITKSDEDPTVKIKKKTNIVGTYLNPINILSLTDHQNSKEKFINAPASTYYKGSHNFILFLKCFLILLRSEKTLAQTILPSKSVLSVFSKLCEESFSLFSDLAEQLLKSQKKTPNKIYGISVLLDTYTILKELFPSFENVLKDIEGGGIITSFWSKLKTTSTSMLQQFLVDIKNDSSRTLPTDGNVHENTSMTINFLKHLFSFRLSILDLLPPITELKESNIFANYIASAINKLKENLELKAKKAEKKNVAQVSTSIIYSSATSLSALSNIFLINNYYFILKSISNQPISLEIGDTIIEEYSNLFEEQKDVYKQSWSKILNYLSEDNNKTSLNTKKTNESIKQKFKSFNSAIAELFTQQVQFFISDIDLRRSMRSILLKIVVPPYQSFLEKYKDFEFTKHREKYIKFDSDTLEILLGKFFEGYLKSSSKLHELIVSIQQDNSEKTIQML